MRARRRNDKERMKRKAKRLYPRCKQPGRFADNLTACSYHGCGNPRHHDRGWRQRTRQEIKQRDKEAVETNVAATAA